MICSNCGHEIEDGKLYCDFCGISVQVVPDYNALDDDMLASLLHDSPQKESHKKADVSKRISESKKNVKKKQRKKFLALILVIALVLCAILGMVIYFHSDGYYYKTAQAKDDAKQYEQAISYYEKCIATYPVKARVKIGRDYYRLEQYDKAEEILLEALDLDETYVETYRNLLKVYAATESYDEMEALQATVEDADILKLFSAYVTDHVSFSEEEGTYHDDFTLELSAPLKYDIYYTVDETTPSKENGTHYEDPIELTDGTTTVKAVCVDESGTSGAVTTKTYKISYVSPDYPVVTPSSGTYHVSTDITMTTESGNRIYYTWDGSIPSADSDEYTEPITIPEGNHILSVIVVDQHGLTSGILKMNYQYLP